MPTILTKIKKSIGSKINKILDFGNFNVETVGIYDDGFEDEIDENIVEIVHDLITYGRVE